AYTVLYSFGASARDGWLPYGGVVQGADGALYGTTANGGSYDDGGTVFKLNTNGSGYMVLFSFDSSFQTGCPHCNGYTPQAGLVQGIDGALYGTTFGGGSNNVGTVFKISTNGTGYATLHSFAPSVDNE